MYVIKKDKPVRAFPLGAHTLLEQQLLQTNQIFRLEDGAWRVRTRESLEEGELAHDGDYIKLDAAGMPYPAGKAWFEANHIHLQDDWYQQKAVPKKAWHSSEPVCPELQYILDKGQLTWDPGARERAFSAWLWGTLQTADGDAVIIFDQIQRNEQGELCRVDFHFIVAEEFSQAYDILPQP